MEPVADISNTEDGPPRIMTFRPSYAEFQNFSQYVEYMESRGAHLAGVAKVIPPIEWIPRQSGYNIDEINITIPAPICQIVSGKQGVYQQINLVKRSMTLRQFKELTEEDRYKTPLHEDYEDLERKYWKNVSYIPPYYAADIRGTLTDPGLNVWNINNLDTILNYVNEDYGIEIDGVNTAYLYFGMWKSTFAWHTEDMDLYSINLLHFGAPKCWYAVPPCFGRRLEALANRLFNDNFQECNAHIRHKMTLLSPQVLKHNRVPFNKITQEAGEIIITFPFGYHAGFNHGFNGAESTNFASPRWIEYGKRAQLCRCRQDVVKISMETFVKRFQPDKLDDWLRGVDYGYHPEDPTKLCSAPPPTINVYKPIQKKKICISSESAVPNIKSTSDDSVALNAVQLSSIIFNKTCRVELTKLNITDMKIASIEAATISEPTNALIVNSSGSKQKYDFNTTLILHLKRLWSDLPSNGKGKNLLTNGVIQNTKRMRATVKDMILDDDEEQTVCNKV